MSAANASSVIVPVWLCVCQCVWVYGTSKYMMFVCRIVANPWHTANPRCHGFLGQKSCPEGVIYHYMTYWHSGMSWWCVQKFAASDFHTHAYRTSIHMTLLCRKVTNLRHTSNPRRHWCVVKKVCHGFLSPIHVGVCTSVDTCWWLTCWHAGVDSEWYVTHTSC